MRNLLPELILFSDYLGNKIEDLNSQLNEARKVDEFNKVCRVLQAYVNAQELFEVLFSVKKAKGKKVKRLEDL
jgi:hypothetical protein